MVVVFDAYGTVLDVDGAARAASAEFPQIESLWPHLAERWRGRQLRYSWLRSLMGCYVPFWQITQESLDVTLDEMSGVLASLDKAALRARLLSLYLQLPAYGDAEPMLRHLKAAGHRLAILSNGNPRMLGAALEAAGIKEYFDAVLSVDGLQCYKPAPQVYQLVLDEFAVNKEDVVFFSSNNWDVAGAGTFGFRTFWVNRGGGVWDDVPARPHKEIASLDAGQVRFL